MRVVADENIPALDLWRSAGHELLLLPGRTINSSHLENADILLVRSVTAVNEALLTGSRLSFIGTATSGTDHIDRTLLKERGIPFASADGANAQSVVDYVFSALATLSITHGFNWLEKSVGIVGGGNIGSRLCHQLNALGLDVRVSDPFLDETSPIYHWLSTLDQVMACDVVTLHVPLTREGAHPTWHMFDRQKLSMLNKHQVLINTARGEVVDNHALLSSLQKGEAPTTILDVWENEPGISPELARRVFLGSPHIAGYSAEGKIRGSHMLLEAWQKLNGRHQATTAAPEPPVSVLAPSVTKMDRCAQLSSLVLQAYDVRNDAQRFNACFDSPDLASDFDYQRKHYPLRHEFSRYRVRGAETSPDLTKSLAVLGFEVS